MQRSAIVAAALLVSAAADGGAAAQNLHAAVPLEGPHAEWFVPPAWKAAHQARGDLNRDGREDVAPHLVPAGFGGEGDDPMATAPAEHGLVVLLAERGGGLRRAGFTTVLLPTGVPSYRLDLSIRRGTLTVRQRFGEAAITELTHRFRHDPASDRFVLIRRNRFAGVRPPRSDLELRDDDYTCTGCGR